MLPVLERHLLPGQVPEGKREFT